MKNSSWQKIGLALLSLVTIAVLVTLIVVLLNGTGNQQVLNKTVADQSTTTQAVTTTASPVVTQGAAAAQATPVSPKTRTIAVSVIGQVQATPDTAYLSFGTEVQAPTAKESLDKTAAISGKIRQALLDLGIPDKNIQTQNASTYPEYPASKDGTIPLEPRNYRANLNFNVVLDDISKAGAVLDAVTKAGANRVTGLSWLLKDDSQFRLQALDNAVKLARPKAEAMVKGLNLAVGEVLSVDEDLDGYTGPMYGGGKGGDGIAPGQLTVSVRVNVTFAIG